MEEQEDVNSSIFSNIASRPLSQIRPFGPFINNSDSSKTAELNQPMRQGADLTMTVDVDEMQRETEMSDISQDDVEEMLDEGLGELIDESDIMTSRNELGDIDVTIDASDVSIREMNQLGERIDEIEDTQSLSVYNVRIR